MVFNIKKIKLKNGMKVGFVNFPGDNIVCVHLRGLAGSNYESISNIGTAHLLEHILLDKSVSGLNKIADSKIIGISSRDDVLFGFKAFKQQLPHITSYIHEILSQAYTIPKNVELHKEAVYTEIKRHLSNPEKYLARIIYQNLFLNQRLAYLNTGNINQVEKITPGMLQNFYQKNYSPENFVCVVTGNLCEREVKEITKKLDTIPININKNNITSHIQMSGSKKTASRIIFPGMESVLTKINFYGYPFNDPHKYALLVLAKILENKLKTRVTSFSAGSYGFLDITSWSKEIGTKNILEDIKIDNTELSEIKKSIINRFLLSLDKVSCLTDFYSEILLYGNDNLDMTEELNNIKKCSLEEIQNVLDYLQKQNPVITVLAKEF